MSGRSSFRLVLQDCLITGTIAAVVLAVAYRLVNENFAYIYLTALLGALAGAVLISTGWLKNGFVLLTAVAFSLLVGEMVLRLAAATGSGEPGAVRQAYTKGYSEPLRKNGGPLGYAPFADRRVRAWKTAGNGKVYDATYGITPEATRVTPGGPARSNAPQTFVFFGGSYVFGEGLEDDQTLPYYFSRALGFEHRVVNLGFMGYGPHQMLRALELGLFDDLFQAPVSAVIYVANPNHVARAAGKVSWDPFGPRYVLETPERLRYLGPFTRIEDGWETPYYLALQVIEVARRSLLIDRLARAFASTTNRDGDAAERLGLFAKIVEKSSEIVRDKFGAAFYVLLWDSDNPLSDGIKDRLMAAKLPTILVSDSIAMDDRKAYIIPNGVHPNAAANQVLAHALSEAVLAR